MKHPLRLILALTLPLAALGCAGGWRNGPPPEWTPHVASTSPSPAAQVAPVQAAAGNATHAIADGIVFVFAGNANSVNVAGDFNSWSTSADALKKQADGSWSLAKKLAPGRHTYKFVLDGGTWTADPTAKETADDGFGGKNAVIAVGGTAAANVAPAGAPTVGSPAANADGVVFRFAGAAGSVSLAGEFNSWSPTADPLTKQADGSWAVTRKLAPGRYQYKFVLDEGTWKEDPSAKETTDDGFGGKNSVVVVGGEATPPTAAPAAPGVAPAAKQVTGAPRAPRVTSDGVVFTYAGSARGVSLCGGFNHWVPTADPMQHQADGTWTITKRLPKGEHGYKFLVDGTHWKVDEANPDGQDDGFGGRSSVVTVK